MQADRDGTSNVDFLTEAADPNRVPSSRYRIVTSGFFEAMGTKVLAGRTFTEGDRTTTQSVVVVNRAFAQKFLQGANPVGSAFAYGFPVVDRANPVLIVGVIDDVRYKAIAEEAEPTFYLSQGADYVSFASPLGCRLEPRPANRDAHPTNTGGAERIGSEPRRQLHNGGSDRRQHVEAPATRHDLDAGLLAPVPWPSRRSVSMV